MVYINEYADFFCTFNAIVIILIFCNIYIYKHNILNGITINLFLMLFCALKTIFDAVIITLLREDFLHMKYMHGATEYDFYITRELVIFSCILSINIFFFVFKNISYYNEMIDNVIVLTIENDELIRINEEREKNKELPTHVKKIYYDSLEHKECSICLCDAEFEKIFITLCGHYYHKECIDKSLDISPKCPICRKII